MKRKQVLTITSLGFIALLSCGLVFHLSCHKDECSGCYLTNDELAFIFYTQGQKVIFKNDITGILDTLCVIGKVINPSTCSYPCDNGYESIYTWFTFSHLAPFTVDLNHGQSPIIGFKNDYVYNLNVSTQTFIVNSTTYNDVYSVQVDSTGIISHGDQQTVPWKIYYSKSKGFVRFYMLNGQTWSKL